MGSDQKHRRGVLKAMVAAISSMALIKKTSAAKYDQTFQAPIADSNPPMQLSPSPHQGDRPSLFRQSGSGALERDLDLKLREMPVSLEDFGGGIAVKDNTPALVAALKTNRPLHLTCPVPLVSAVYRFASTIDFGRLFQKDGTKISVVVITGEGKGRTILQYTGTGIGFVGGANAPVTGGYAQTLMMHNLSYVGVGRVPDGVAPSIPVRYFHHMSEANVFAGSDSMQTAIYWEFDAASTISNCEIARFGTGIRTKLGYGATIRNSHFRYNNISIELTQAVTTVSVVDNVIERSGIGVALYQSSLCLFRGNAIQGNYGGCDIYSFIWNKGHKFDANYFEASSRVFVQDGGSADSALVNTAFEFTNNIGLKVELVAFAENWFFRRNLIGDVDINSRGPSFLVAADNVRGIVVEDNLQNEDPRLKFTNYVGSGVKHLVVRDSPVVARMPYNMDRLKAGESSEHIVPLPGVQPGDSVSISFNQPVDAVQLHGWVTDEGTVTLACYNPPYGRRVEPVAGELIIEVFAKLR